MKTFSLILSIVTVGYFAPWTVAVWRKKKDSTAIFWLDLLLGWTFIGWAIALIWATKKD